MQQGKDTAAISQRQPPLSLAQLGWPTLLLFALIAISFYSYLLFHVLSEFFSIIIGIMMFAVAWHGHAYSRNNFLMFIACGYFWVAVLDLIHTLTYKGMNVIAVEGANTATQLWISARYGEAFLLLVAPLFLTRALKRHALFKGFGVTVGIVTLLIFSGYFPQAYIEGQGLTPFKITSEYIVIALLLGALAHLIYKRQYFSERTLHLLSLTILFTVASELAFTFYVSVYDFSNLIGHIFKIISFWLLYIAIVRVSLKQPYTLLQEEIRERTHAQEELRTNEENIATTLHSIADAVIATDIDGHITRMNPVAEDLTGWKLEDATGMAAREVLKLSHTKTKEAIETPTDATLRTGELTTFSNHTELIAKDGTAHQIKHRTAPIIDQAGKIRGAVMVFHDVTEEYHLQEELELRQFAIDQSQDEVHWVGNDGKFLHVNKASCDAMGYSREEFLRLGVYDINPHYPREAWPETWRALQEHKILSTETEQITKDGRIYPVEIQVALFEYGDNEYAFTVARDITERKRVEEALRLSDRVLATSPDHISVVGRDYRYKRVNHTYELAHGLPADELVGKHVGELLGQEVFDTLVKPNLDHCLAGNEVHYESWFRFKKAGDRYMAVSYLPLKSREGKVEGVVVISHDLTERKQSEEALRLAAIAFEANEGIVITDINTVILRINQAFTQITGYSANEAVGKKVSLLKSGRQDPAFYQAMWDELNSNGRWQGEIWDRRKSGEIYPQWLNITAVKDEDGRVSHYVGHFLDISERKRAESLEYYAHYDPLTELPNRRYLEELLTLALAQAKRRKHMGALLFIDLDRFKPINDTLGHAVGDSLLQEVAKRLRACIRREDSPARYGGDEFIILLPMIAQDMEMAESQAERVAEKIRAALSEPYLIQCHRLEVTTSIGITLFPSNDTTTDQLFKQADKAMYLAKQSGRNSVQLYRRQ